MLTIKYTPDKYFPVQNVELWCPWRRRLHGPWKYC